MEVHAHTHIPHGRDKKWTHYFWEFVMLFLAVFCGFIAENEREHFIEHKREKQYIHSLSKDVEADIIRLKDLISARNIRGSRLDSLTFFLNSDTAAQLTNDIYFFAVIIPRVTHL